MPTYRYRCEGCGEQLDVWQSIHDEALRVHEGECGGKLLKVLGVGGIVLTGPGFYRTDTRAGAKNGGGSSKDDKSDANGASESKKSDDKKSDSNKAETSSSKSDSSSSKSDSSSSK